MHVWLIHILLVLVFTLTLCVLRDNVNEGMAQTVLFFVTKHLSASVRGNIDFIMICEGRNVRTLNLDGWYQLRDSQLSPPGIQYDRHQSTIMIGEIRDKAQRPIEFPLPPKDNNETFFYLNYDSIHLYLAKECYLLSMPVVEGVVKQAQDHEKNPAERGRYLEGTHHGHDIATLAFFIPRLTMQIISLTKSEQFWTL